MPTITLTQIFVDKLKPTTPGKRIEFRDKVHQGFGVLVGDSGVKTSPREAAAEWSAHPRKVGPSSQLSVSRQIGEQLSWLLESELLAWIEENRIKPENKQLGEARIPPPRPTTVGK
jgi:hypothetical protein